MRRGAPPADGEATDRALLPLPRLPAHYRQRGSGKPARVTPGVHIFTRSKLPWVKLPEGARVFEAFYDPAKVRPAESLARWRRNMERRSTQ